MESPGDTILMSDEPCPENGFCSGHANMLCRSHLALIARPLIETRGTAQEITKALYHAPFALLSHTADTDPVFNYANLAAQRLFGMSWSEITALPSRKSAEPLLRQERERLLERVSMQGYIDDYSGVRISRTGKRFLIEQARVWNLVDDAGRHCGQAAMFSNWRWL